MANQARASSQCRFTVAGETSSAAAVSSIVMPANTRHSTTRAAPAWTCSRRVSASCTVQQIVETIVGDDPVEIELDRRRAAAALLRVARGRVVDEHASHRPGGGGKEVRAVPPLDARQADEPRVGLVRQRRGGQGVPAPLAGQAAAARCGAGCRRRAAPAHRASRARIGERTEQERDSLLARAVRGDIVGSASAAIALPGKGVESRVGDPTGRMALPGDRTSGSGAYMIRT